MRILPLPFVPFATCLLLVPSVFIPAQDAPKAAPALHPYIALAESSPVKIGSLEFVVVVQKEWPLQERKDVTLDVQLYIINRGDKDVLFPTFDTFGVGLNDANGKEVQMSGGRDGTIRTQPVLVPAGGRYCLARNASITWDSVRKKPMFMYFDGTGSVADTGLAPGDYTLKFHVESSPKDPPGIMSDGVLIPLWKGKGETNEAKFKVIEVK